MFEHRMVRIGGQNLDVNQPVLDRMSADGWELLAVYPWNGLYVMCEQDVWADCGFILFFKRPKQQSKWEGSQIDFKLAGQKTTPAEISSVLRNAIALEPIRPNQIVCEGEHFVDDRVL